MAKRLTADERRCRDRGYHAYMPVALSYEESEARGPLFTVESCVCDECGHVPTRDEQLDAIAAELRVR